MMRTVRLDGSTNRAHQFDVFNTEGNGMHLMRTLGLVAVLAVTAMLTLPSSASVTGPPVGDAIMVFDTVTPADDQVNLCDPADAALFAVCLTHDAMTYTAALLQPVNYHPALKRTDRRMPAIGGFIDEASWFDFDGLASAPKPKPPK
jgi:hypothetical protein